MGLHHKGKLEMCVHQLHSMNHLRTNPMVRVQILYPENHYKYSYEIILWHCKAALPLGVLIYVCEHVCCIP